MENTNALALGLAAAVAIAGYAVTQAVPQPAPSLVRNVAKGLQSPIKRERSTVAFGTEIENLIRNDEWRRKKAARLEAQRIMNGGR